MAEGIRAPGWRSAALIVAFTLILQWLIHDCVLSAGFFTKYTEAAQNYLAGTFKPARVIDFSPFYFDLSLLLTRLFGDSTMITLWLQRAALGASSVLMLQILYAYFGFRLAVFGAIAFSLLPGPLLLAQIHEPEIWIVLWNIAAIYFLLRNQSLSRLIAAGICLDLSLLTRPTIALFFPFVLASVFLNSGQKRIRNCFAILLILLLPFAIVFFRNIHYLKKPGFVIMDPGSNFFESNNPYAHGIEQTAPLIRDFEAQYPNEPDYAHVLGKRFPSAYAGRSLGSAEASSYWLRKSLNFISDHPGAYLKLLMQKANLLFRSWESYDFSTGYQLSRCVRNRGFLFLPFSIVSALALLGLFLNRRKWRESILFYGGFFTYLFFALVYYVSARMRLPLIPFLLFFSLSAVNFLIEKRKRLFGFIGVIALAILIDAPQDFIREHDRVWEKSLEARRLQTQAGSLRDAGKRKLAAAKIIRAVAGTPYLHELRVLSNLPYSTNGVLSDASSLLRDQLRARHDPSTLFDLGFLLVEDGQYEEARNIFEALRTTGATFYRWNYCPEEPSYYLGRIAQLTGNLNAAISYYDETLKQHPGQLEALAHVAVLQEQQGNKSAADSYKKKLFSYYDEIDASFFLAKAYLDSNLNDQAAMQFQRVAEWLPEYRKAHLYLFLALARSGKFEKALPHYQRAMAISADPLFPHRELLQVFEKNMNQYRNSVEAYYVLGVLYRQHGQFALAKEIQLNALKVHPDYKPSLEELRALSSVQPD